MSLRWTFVVRVAVKGHRWAAVEAKIDAPLVIRINCDTVAFVHAVETPDAGPVTRRLVLEPELGGDPRIEPPRDNISGLSPESAKHGDTEKEDPHPDTSTRK